jgi:outer membrane protein OmpA-like peptidoglycan-associated protein
MKPVFICLFCLFFSNLFAQEPQDTNVVYFPFDDYGLTSEAKATLNQFIAAYKTKKAALIIKGHCDARGTDDYNEILSEKRVASVRNYLLQHGITESAIRLSEGFGEREPLNQNSTAEERRLNRRVELIWPVMATSEVSVIQPPKQPEVTLKEKIDTVKEGGNLRLQNINFYGGRHTFLPQSMPALNELLEVMKNNPNLVIEIQGHICCFRGEEDGMDYDANEKRLSVNRARAVYEFLNENGIDKKRMTYKGFAGTKRMIEEEQSEIDRTLNRRVEIKVLRK